MDFDLKEIGATVLIGAYVFLAAEASLYYLLAINLTGFYRGRLGFERESKEVSGSETANATGDSGKRQKPGPTSPIPFPVFIAISLLLGILAEDFAVNVAENYPKVLTRPVVQMNPLLSWMPTIEGMRYSNYRGKEALYDEVLIKDFFLLEENEEARENKVPPPECTTKAVDDTSGDTSSLSCPHATPLGNDIGQSGLVVQLCRDMSPPLTRVQPSDQPSPKPDAGSTSSGTHAPKPGTPGSIPLSDDPESLQQFLRGSSEGPRSLLGESSLFAQSERVDTWKKCMARIFYDSKNRVYRDPNYYDELKRYDIRRHLAAGFALYSLIFIAQTVALMFIRPRKLLRLRRKHWQLSKPHVWKLFRILSGWFAAILPTAIFIWLTHSAMYLQWDPFDHLRRFGAGYLFIATALLFLVKEQESVQRSAASRAGRGRTARRMRAGHRFAMAVTIVLMLFSIYVGSIWAYSYETVEYNKRVFGYFRTLYAFEAAPLQRLESPSSNGQDERH